MAFLDKLTAKTLPPHDAALTCAVTTLALSGDFTDVDRRIISLFRDQFSPLSFLDEAVFVQSMEQALQRVQAQNLTANLPNLVNTIVAPAITSADDRTGLYKYIYSLAMADLNINDAEAQLIASLQTTFALGAAAYTAAENSVLTDFRGLHQALAAISLGLIVVTADGVVQDSELAEIKSDRTLLDPIGRLDDLQFGLVYDLGMLIHDRYLLDVSNRADFLNNIVAKELGDTATRIQAFQYAAAIATADGDIAQPEIDTLKEIIKSLQLPEADGERVFNQYMARVRTVDGKPISQ